MNEPVRIEAVRARDLKEFADRFFSDTTGQIMVPISRQRAYSQSANPAAAPDDVVLFVAWDGHRCVGYHGWLPGELHSDGVHTKVYWSTTLFVAPEYRRRLVALQLVKAAIARRVDLAVSEFADIVESVFPALGFRSVEPVPYVTLDLHRIVPLLELPSNVARRHPEQAILRRLAVLTRRLSHRISLPMLRATYYALALPWARRVLRDVMFQEVSRVRSPPTVYDEVPPDEPHFRRDDRAVNWILSWPWLHEEPDPPGPSYRFSGVRELFRQHAVELYRSGDYHGFVVFALQRRKGRTIAKIIDMRVCDWPDCEAVAAIVLTYGARYRVDQIDAPVSLESALQQLPFARHVIGRAGRRFLFRPSDAASPLGRELGRLRLSSSDGDCAFW